MKSNTTRKDEKESIGLAEERADRPEGETKPARVLSFVPDERDLIDDPIHLYLREIGKVALLTAKEEQYLASKVEEAKYLRRIESLHLEHGDGASPEVGAMLYLLHQLVAVHYVINTIALQLGLAHKDSFNRTIRNPKLRVVVDGVIG